MQIKPRNSFSLTKVIKMSKIIILEHAGDETPYTPSHTAHVLHSLKSRDFKFVSSILKHCYIVTV